MRQARLETELQGLPGPRVTCLGRGQGACTPTPSTAWTSDFRCTGRRGGMPAAEAEGALKAKCQMDNDKKPLVRMRRKRKVSLSGSSPSSGPALLRSISWGIARAVGATTTHPALDHLSNQQRGKSPSTEQVLCGMQSIADPALTGALLEFQLLLEKTSYGCPLSPSPSLALPVQTPM